MDLKEYEELRSDTANTIRIVNKKQATSVSIMEVYSAKRAYEQLFMDGKLVPLRAALQKCNLNNYIVPNLIYDRERSEASREELVASVPHACGVVQRGQKIVERGQVVDQQTLLVIESYKRELDRRYDKRSGLTTMIGGELLYVLIIIIMFTLYLQLFRKDYFERLRSVGMIYSLVVIACITASMLISHNLLHVFILPFAIVPIFIRVFMDSRTAFAAHVTVVLICACQLMRPLEFTAVELVAGMAAIMSLRELSSRSQLFWTALVTTAAAMLTDVSIFLIRSGNIDQIDVSELTYLGICGVMIFCCYPILYIIEKFFGFISAITGKDMKMTVKEADSTANAMVETVRAKYLEQKYAESKKKNEDYLAENAKKDSVVTLPSPPHSE